MLSDAKAPSKRGPVRELHGGYGPTLSGICLFAFHCAMGLSLSARYRRTTQVLVVAKLLYRGYLIVSFSQRIETTGKWGIWDGVVLDSNGERQSKVFNSATDTFDNKHEAEKFGLKWEGLDTQSCGTKRAQPSERKALCNSLFRYRRHTLIVFIMASRI
jgi:hypothetical protein